MSEQSLGYEPDNWILFKSDVIYKKSRGRPRSNRFKHPPDKGQDGWLEKFSYDENKRIDYLKSLVWKIFELYSNSTNKPFRVKCSACKWQYEPKEILKHIDEHRESRNFDEFMDLISKLRNKNRFRPIKPPRHRNKKIDVEKYRVD